MKFFLINGMWGVLSTEHRFAIMNYLVRFNIDIGISDIVEKEMPYILDLLDISNYRFHSKLVKKTVIEIEKRFYASVKLDEFCSLYELTGKRGTFLIFEPAADYES